MVRKKKDNVLLFKIKLLSNSKIMWGFFCQKNSSISTNYFLNDHSVAYSVAM